MDSKTPKENYKFDFIRKDKYLHLEKDLKSINEIEKITNSQIFIYISPIVPEVYESVKNNLSPKAKDTRNRLFEKCKEFSLNCFSSPYIDNTFSPYWMDSTHPPSKKLGLWVQKEILNAF